MPAELTETTKTIGIVAEYNPFHNGHLFQINQIKKLIPNAVIISVMSGNLVQRGEFALFSKYERAGMAVLNGVDAVLELPPIWSCAPANIFAFASVYILHSLQIIDLICFGSECGDLELLNFAAEKTCSVEFNVKLNKYIKAHKNLSYPQNVAHAFLDLYGDEKADIHSIFTGSNNILAVEYLKALKKLDSRIIPMTIKRSGRDYNTVSASYIRDYLLTNKGRPNELEEMKKYMPENSYNILADLTKSEKFADINNISSAVISYITRLDVKEISRYAGTGGGEEYRIKKAVENSFDYNSLIQNLEAKHGTSSSVRRMILNIFFGITREMQKQPPLYTNLLAANQKGRDFLNTIRKKSQIQIITKPASNDKYKNNIDMFIDNVYKLSLFNRDSEINAIKEKPYIY
ncbi:MAG: nucleotidyltransferase family protein [Oscillospiraceae bacterium]|nr:nucleotidyltransferase family protein [Oscillospiraceae bacterium]